MSSRASARRTPLARPAALSRSALAVALGALSLVAAPPVARAQTDSQKAAQLLFDEAIDLLGKGKAGDACPKLEQSYKLDPAVGVQFRLAECYEKVGKVASAWSTFQAVADTMRKVGNAEKEGVARGRADALRDKLPKLSVKLEAAVSALDGLEVLRDGQPIDKALVGQELPVDPGEHTVEVRARGRRPATQKVVVAAGPARVVSFATLELEAGGAPGPGSAEGPTAPTSPGFSPLRGAAIGVGVVGLAGLGLGIGMGLSADSTYKAARARCPGGGTTGCPADAVTGSNDAYTQATISTVGFVAGGVLLAGAIVLFVAAPSGRADKSEKPQKSERRAEKRASLVPIVAPVLSPEGGGAMVLGRF